MISKNQLGALPGITADRVLTKLPQDGSATELLGQLGDHHAR